MYHGKMVKSNDGYLIIYNVNDVDNKERQIGVKCVRNAQTGKIEVQQNGIIKEDELKRVEINDSNSISYEQMEMQVVKNNIEKSMKDTKINEILEIKDSKILEYLNNENNLQDFSDLTDPTRVFMISTQDKEGNNHYEFVAHNGRDSYTKLSGMKEVSIEQKNIIVGEDRIQGAPTPMQKVNCQFKDKNGKDYYVYHPFENSSMELATEEMQRGNDEESVVKTEDHGVNKLFHKARINELLRAGRNAMGIGYEKVKQIIAKYRGQEHVKKQESEKEMGE